jgi:hypothetical protein
VDILTTLPWDWMVLTATGVAANTTEGRYIALLSLFKLGRMYRLIVMFYNISYNLSVGLLALTLMRNFTVGAKSGASFILQIAGALEGGVGCVGQGVEICLWRQCLLVKHTPGRVDGGKVWMRLQGVGSSCTVLCCTVLRLIVKFYNIS